jgi:hypothetical protein
MGAKGGAQAQQGRAVVPCVGDRGQNFLARTGDTSLEHGTQNLVTRGEVVIDAAGFDLGCRRDTSHGHLIGAALLEEPCGNLDKTRSGLVSLADPGLPGLLANHRMMIVSFALKSTRHDKDRKSQR